MYPCIWINNLQLGSMQRIAKNYILYPITPLKTLLHLSFYLLFLWFCPQCPLHHIYCFKNMPLPSRTPIDVSSIDINVNVDLSVGPCHGPSINPFSLSCHFLKVALFSIHPSTISVVNTNCISMKVNTLSCLIYIPLACSITTTKLKVLVLHVLIIYLTFSILTSMT